MGGLVSGVEPREPGDVPRGLADCAVLYCEGTVVLGPGIRDSSAFSRAEWTLGALAARFSPAEGLLPAVLGALPLPGITGGLDGVGSEDTLLLAISV